MPPGLQVQLFSAASKPHALVFAMSVCHLVLIPPWQEAAAAAAARDASRPPGLLHWPANKLLDLFESPKMAAYEVHLQPAVAALQSQPLFGWLALMFLQLIVLRQVHRALVSGKVRAGSNERQCCTV
jgi:hypothetical protein